MSASTTADAGARPDGVAAVEDAEGAGPSIVATVLDYESDTSFDYDTIVDLANNAVYSSDSE